MGVIWLGTETIAAGMGGYTSVPPAFLFGVINDEGRSGHYADEWARGVRATTLELQWKLYEPEEGVYDTDYVAHLKGVMRDLKAQGWYVQLVPGYHYAPDWVYANHPDVYYVNQYGEVYDPDPINDGAFRVINAPFNPQARALISGYIARIFSDFDQSDPGLRFDSVRIGGGVLGELRYPNGEWNGHTNAYWAFDATAQDPKLSGIPDSVIGWRPGVDANPDTVGRGQLIVNPGFEDALPHHPVLGWSFDDEVSYRRFSSDVHSGSYAMELTLRTANRMHQYVRVAPSTTYELRAWLKSADGVGRARVFLTQYDAETVPVSGAAQVKLESNAGTWAEHTAALTTADTARYLKVELDGDRVGTFQFDHLSLRRAGELDDRSRDIAVPAEFYDWYVQALTDYQNWQITEIRAYFGGQLDVLYAGKGVRSTQVTDALTNDLTGDGWSENTSALYGGSAYERHVAGLGTTQGVALYVTGIDEPGTRDVSDGSPYPRDWSAARWIAYLARRRGLPVWGENSGQNDAAELWLSAARMHINGFTGLMWGFESELYADPNTNRYATIDDYEVVTSFYSDLKWTFLPFLSGRQ
jgi:hypothetical protein